VNAVLSEHGDGSSGNETEGSEGGGLGHEASGGSTSGRAIQHQKRARLGERKQNESREESVVKKKNVRSGSGKRRGGSSSTSRKRRGGSTDGGRG
jgi:hypothetical protein